MNTPIWQLTVGEFIELQKMALRPIEEDGADKNPHEDDHRFVYGISGLADLLKCSKVTAQKIKSSGIIDDAVFQYGRKIIIDAEKALRLLKRV